MRKYFLFTFVVLLSATFCFADQADVVPAPNPEAAINYLAGFMLRGIPSDQLQSPLIKLSELGGVLWQCPVDWGAGPQSSLVAFYGVGSPILVAIPVDNTAEAAAVRSNIVKASAALDWMASPGGAAQIVQSAEQHGTAVIQNIGNQAPTLFTNSLTLLEVCPPYQVPYAHNAPIIPFGPTSNGTPLVARMVTGRLGKYVRIRSGIYAKFAELTMVASDGAPVGHFVGWDATYTNAIRTALPFPVDQIEAAAAQLRTVAASYPFLLNQARSRVGDQLRAAHAAPENAPINLN